MDSEEKAQVASISIGIALILGFLIGCLLSFQSCIYKRDTADKDLQLEMARLGYVQTPAYPGSLNLVWKKPEASSDHVQQVP